MPFRPVPERRAVKTRVLSFGSLASALAKNQTQAVIDRIQQESPRLTCQLSILPSPLTESETAGEVFHASSGQEIDFLTDLVRQEQCRLVVIEAADLVQPLPDDLEILCVPDRLTPFDAFLNRQGMIMDEMDPGSRVGVLTARAKAQMSALWPDLDFQILPGGVDRAMETHLRRSEIDGLVLPAAVTELLGIQGIVAEIFSPEFILPGPGQGILLVVGLRGDEEARKDLADIHSQDSAAEYTTEMAFRSRMISDRDVPVGALARVRGDQMVIVGGTGSATHRISVDGDLDQAEEIGAGLAMQILQDTASFADLLEAEFPDGLPVMDDDLDDEDLGNDDLDDDELADDLPDADEESRLEAEIEALKRRKYSDDPDEYNPGDF
jgi:hydroxymethylbilane synthase